MTPVPQETVSLGDGGFEADLVDLASRFSAPSGGGLSPELSADLALQIVHNEIVEKACQVLSASGAAIALWRDAEMVCRATNGTSAPELGARLDTASGLSGKCLQTRLTQRCNDLTKDPQADVDASTRLGARSMMAVPLLKGSDPVGILAVFSPQADAFSDRDQLALEGLAQRVLQSIERAGTLATAEPAPTADHTTDLSPAVSLERLPESQSPPADDNPVATPPAWIYPVATWIVALIVVAGGIWMGTRVADRLGWGETAVNINSEATAAGQQTVPAPKRANLVHPSKATSPAHSGSGVADASPKATSSAVPTTATARFDTGPRVGGLAIYENGKEIFRAVPPGNRSVVHDAQMQPPVLQPAASLEPERPVEVSGLRGATNLLRSVVPAYPEAALQQRIQGPVILDVRIGRDGGVQSLHRVSGDDLLVRAAENAVKQWRFKPLLVAGHPAQMQTRVTLNFRLP